MNEARATPVHTIVRYAPSSIEHYAGWEPVRVCRFRLFVDASHEAVTGESRGARWDHCWSCESLHGDQWRLEGRNDWPTLEDAIAATSAGTFATFEDARAEARRLAEHKRDAYKRRMLETQWNVTTIANAKPPVLPP
jgi:hypothetical protein